MILFTSLLFALPGLALLGGGLWLVLLGGSWHYLLVGIGFVVTAALVAMRSRAAVWLYAAVMLATLAWAVWEVGLDWWRLAPRGGVVVMLGLWLWLPAVRRRLDAAGEMRGPSGWPVGLAAAICVAVAVVSMLRDPHAIEGRLPEAAADRPAPAAEAVPPGDWPSYGRTGLGQRYAPLDAITPANVATLERVWTYRTGDMKRPDDVTETTYQATPLKIGDLLYLCTPHDIAIALDAATGEERWRFDARSGMNSDRQHQTCRGVTYWEAEPAEAEQNAGGPERWGATARPAGQAQDGPPCRRRIFLPTADARLIALDAATGEVCPRFGDEGAVHLEAGMPYTPPGFYYSTSPPVAVDGLVIIGGAINDNVSVHAQSGVIRAYDAQTGELVWNWDSADPEETAPIDLAAGETYTPNSPNSWSVFAADPELGLVYIPLGNQTPDQLGMNRSPEVEAHSSSVVALDIRTGEKRWVFQTVHHDLWDMDVPAQPVLLDLSGPDGGSTPALVQPTKQGDVYVLDRRTGEPLLEVTEEPAPGGAIPEDRTAPTQPTSALSFKPAPLTGADTWGITMFDQLVCRIRLKALNYEGRYTPPSVNGTLVHPGNFGVFNWGSVAVDPVRQAMFAMPTYLPFTSRLVPRSEIAPAEARDGASEQGLNRNEGAPYGVVMGPFLGPLGIPCTAPPWGYVAGADLRTGEIAWRHRNGTVEDMTPLPLPFRLGVPGIGGPIVTAGGVAFLAASVDDYIRGYDLTTGEQLWRARLPAGGQATPMSYEQDGRQFVAIVAGGHGSIGTTPGDHVIAYALPDR